LPLSSILGGIFTSVEGLLFGGLPTVPTPSALKSPDVKDDYAEWTSSAPDIFVSRVYASAVIDQPAEYSAWESSHVTYLDDSNFLRGALIGRGKYSLVYEAVDHRNVAGNEACDCVIKVCFIDGGLKTSLIGSVIGIQAFKISPIQERIINLAQFNGRPTYRRMSRLLYW
jgi:hypothetical protein